MKTMTKVILSAAVATSVSTGANAIAVSGTVTALQLAVSGSGFELMGGPQATFNGMTIGGDTVTGLTLSGDMVGYAAGTWIGISWNLTNGMRQGVNGAGGTIFEGGTISYTTSTDGGITYTPFDTLDASVTHLPFLAGDNGFMFPAPTQTTAGFVVDDAGYGTLPGLWDLVVLSPSFNNAVGTFTLFGQSVGVFMEGSVAPVPVPAAAWLFGSALLGLAGLKRKR